MPKTSLRGDQLTAEGLHCIMLPVIPYSSGRAKEVSFASGVSWMSDGELGTPKTSQSYQHFWLREIRVYIHNTVTRRDEAAPSTAQITRHFAHGSSSGWSERCTCTFRWPTGADLTGGHSCSGRRGPWEAGPWRPQGFGGPRRLNFGLQLQSPDCNLNWFYNLFFKLETSTLIQRFVLSEF